VRFGLYPKLLDWAEKFVKDKHYSLFQWNVNEVENYSIILIAGLTLYKFLRAINFRIVISYSV